MDGLVEVVDGGIGNSIQDAGRFGFRHMGITVSGCLDGMLARCANALVGNAPTCAGIEVRGAGPTLQVRQGRVRMALAGELSATLRRKDGEVREVPAWASVSLDVDDVLEVGYLGGGTAFLALAGGIDSPLQLGSRSTYQRAMIGGIGGKPVATGNLLPCATQRRRELREFRADPWPSGEATLRVMLGPQEGHFKPESVAQLLGEDYQVSTQLDRMGIRLDGPALGHIGPEAADIVSDGVTPGVIQVPGNGQPIILLADCQTVGGYPKIATVISADLPRLGQLRPGQKVRFVAVSAAQARQALCEREALWNHWAYGIEFAVPGTPLNRDLRCGWPAAIE